MTDTEECKHEFRTKCVRCGVGLADLPRREVDPDPEFDAMLEEISDDIARELVTSVRVEFAGAHERVSVWIRGMLVGTLTVGEGQGRMLHHLLRSEGILRAAKALASEWYRDDRVNRHALDSLVTAFDIAQRVTDSDAEGEGAAS